MCVSNRCYLFNLYPSLSPSQLSKYFASFSNTNWGAPVAQWVQRWPIDLALTSLSPTRGEIFLTVNGFHCAHAAALLIICPLSSYDWNTIEKDEKSQVVHPSIHLKHQSIFSLFISPTDCSLLHLSNTRIAPILYFCTIVFKRHSLVVIFFH